MGSFGKICDIGCGLSNSVCPRCAKGNLPICGMLVQHLVSARCPCAWSARPGADDEKRSTAIRRHRWPGDIRELKNCLRRAVVLATGDVIRREHRGDRDG